MRYVYGPGGEFLPDGKARVIVHRAPTTFWGRVRHVLHIARHAWRSTR